MNSNKELSKLLNRETTAATDLNSEESLDYLIDLNQVIMGLVHKLCERKQRQHLVEYFIDTRNTAPHSPKSATNVDLFKFIVPSNDGGHKISRYSKTSKSVYQNLAHFAKPTTRRSVKRSSSLGSSSSLESLGSDSSSRRHHKDRRPNNNKLTSLLFSNSIIKKSQSSLTSNSTSSRKPSHLLNFLSGASVVDNSKSIRKYIFNKIVGGAPSQASMQQTSEQNGGGILNGFKFKRFKNPNDIRQFWKKVISEQIILSKMEKEHRKMNVRATYLRERHRQEREKEGRNNGDSSSSKLMTLTSSSALNYVEITPCLKEVDKIWTQWLGQGESEAENVQVELEEIRYGINITGMLLELDVHNHQMLLNFLTFFTIFKENRISWRATKPTRTDLVLAHRTV